MVIPEPAYSCYRPRHEAVSKALELSMEFRPHRGTEPEVYLKGVQGPARLDDIQQDRPPFVLRESLHEDMIASMEYSQEIDVMSFQFIADDLHMLPEQLIRNPAHSVERL